MKKMSAIRKLLAFLLASVLLMGVLPTGIQAKTEREVPAAEQGEPVFHEKYGYDPIYEDLDPVGYMKQHARPRSLKNAPAASYTAKTTSYSSIKEAGAVLRQAMIDKVEEVTLDFTSWDGYYGDLWDELMEEALRHTGEVNEGDYLRWQAWWGGGWYTNGTLIFDFTFFTTPEMEEKVTAKVDEVIKSLDLGSKKPYERVKAVYDYITYNIRYDYEHVNMGSDYLTQFTAYGGIIDNTCVCQGYAVLLYRMLMECHVDCRVVTSYSHAWNIVKIGNAWYVADSTWDEGVNPDDYWFFLITDETLLSRDTSGNHEREEPYCSEEFYAAHVMATSDCPSNISVPNVTAGWKQNKLGWWYQNADNTYTVKSWKKVGNDWYHFDEKGYMQTGWVKDGANWYHMDENGAMQTGWQQIAKKWYYLGTDGIMQTGWQQIAKKWYYFDANGVMQTGWQQIAKKWYYFDANGVMSTGWQQIAKKWYYFDAKGIMQTGWQKIDGKWYYLGTDGIVQTGWQKISGKWYYFDAAGAMATGWQKVGSDWYCFDTDGVMLTGWQKVDGKWYYLGTDGILCIGWKEIGGKWYHFDAAGAMHTGWQKISSDWYYFETDGVMHTGWLEENGDWFYFESKGQLVTGWKTISSKTYYFKADGKMAKSEWWEGYWLNADGTWTYKYKAAWKQASNGKWWYGDESGWYAKSQTLKIDGKSYTFDANGYLK